MQTFDCREREGGGYQIKYYSSSLEGGGECGGPLAVMVIDIDMNIMTLLLPNKYLAPTLDLLIYLRAHNGLMF